MLLPSGSQRGRYLRVLSIQLQTMLSVAAIPLLLMIRRAVRDLETCTDESGGDGAVPLGWHVPPEQFTRDSSESDSESGANVRSRLLRGQRALREYFRSGHKSASSWSEFKRQRRREKGFLGRASTE